jgi:hypothetical protein
VIEPVSARPEIGMEMQQQSTLILDEEEVGAAHIAGEFADSHRLDVLPSFEASQIITAA